MCAGSRNKLPGNTRTTKFNNHSFKHSTVSLPGYSRKAVERIVSLTKRAYARPCDNEKSLVPIPQCVVMFRMSRRTPGPGPRTSNPDRCSNTACSLRRSHPSRILKYAGRQCRHIWNERQTFIMARLLGTQASLLTLFSYNVV